MTAAEYIMARCVPVPFAGCWIWTPGANTRGYGQAVFRGQRYLAHRLSYLTFRGPIGNGLILRHSCDSPWCVNPDHLSTGTDADNNRDKQTRGRAARKLDADAVRAIRESSDTDSAAAFRYGVSRSMVNKNRCRDSWDHVSGGGKNRNPVKFGIVQACIARHMRRRGERIADIAHAFGASHTYMRHIINRRRWTNWAAVDNTDQESES